MSPTSARADAILISRRAAGVHILLGALYALKHLGIRGKGGLKYPFKELWLPVSLRKIKEGGEIGTTALRSCWINKIRSRRSFL